MVSLLFYFFLALGVSFFCSLLEAVLLSIPSSHIALMLEQKKSHAQLLKRHKDHVTRPLSAILTLNTTANTLGAAGVGAQVAALYGNQWVALASGLLTFLILVFSEIIPKTIGATYAKELARSASYVIQALVYLLFPVVFLLAYISKVLSKGTQAKISRDEIRAISHLAATEGSLSKKEFAVIRNLLALRTTHVRQVMTPLSVAFSFPKDAVINDIVKNNKLFPYARIPLFDGQPDNIVGLVIRFRILDAFRGGSGEESVESLMQPVFSVDAATSISDFLTQCFARQQQLFIVKENEKTCGIVTLEDALETLLGVEIVDETDKVVDMQALAKRLETMRARRRKSLEDISKDFKK